MGETTDAFNIKFCFDNLLYMIVQSVPEWKGVSALKFKIVYGESSGVLHAATW